MFRFCQMIINVTCRGSGICKKGWKLCSQFHQHFMSSFSANILLPKKFKAKLSLEKSCAKHFCTKKGSIKCWQNWYLGSISSTFYTKLLRQQIPNPQNNTVKLSVFFCAFGICARKSFASNIDEIDIWSSRQDKKKRLY